jgi:hypothetical protein
MKLRATLAILCLATLSVAAPAPSPRPRRAAEPHPWGEPANGLRMRLVPAAKRFPAGARPRLFLELQNVSGKDLYLTAPDLPAQVSFPDETTAGWALTGERVDGRGAGRDSILGCAKKMEAECAGLADGQTLRIEITLTDELEALKELVEEGEERKARMHFPAREDGPGTYELRATFQRRRLRGQKDAQQHKEAPGTWSAERLSSPPVRIELE